MVLCSCCTTISESRNAFGMATLRTMALCKPKMSASYSAVLFVHSNSKKLEIKCFLCSGSIKTKPAPEPSYILEPSKYKVHISYVQALGTTLVLLLLLLTVQMPFLLVELGRSSNFVSGGTGDGCAR